MIGALRYFAARMFASRYWPKVGSASVAPTLVAASRTWTPQPRRTVWRRHDA